MNRSIFGLVALGLVALGGCSNEDAVVDIRGTVTRNGKPVPNCTVHFVPVQGRPSWGATDENGNFSLSYDPQTNGAEVGKHNVYVEFRVNSPEEEHLRSIGKWKIPKDQKEILEAYGDPSNPAIEVEVTEDGDPIEIKLD